MNILMWLGLGIFGIGAAQKFLMKPVKKEEVKEKPVAEVKAYVNDPNKSAEENAALKAKFDQENN